MVYLPLACLIPQHIDTSKKLARDASVIASTRTIVETGPNDWQSQTFVGIVDGGYNQGGLRSGWAPLLLAVNIFDIL